MKKGLVLALVIALGLGVALQKDTIAQRILEAGMNAQMGRNATAELPDGLHVGLCGAGGPLPAPNASGPCVVIAAGSQMFVVDAGTDGVRNLIRMGFQPGTISAVLLTHFHSDHIDGLGELATLRWVNNANTVPLPVYGATGVDNIVKGFNIAYQLDTVYRHAHHGDSVAPLSGAGMLAKSFDKPNEGASLVLIETPDLKIETFSVDHSPVDPAVGYKFTYKGRTALITGDTVKSDTIIQHSRNIDLLVHEALAPNLINLMHDTAVKKDMAVLANVTSDILDYHASPMDAAETAKEAGVKHLLYYHIVPPLVAPGQAQLFLDGAQDVFNDYTIGQDGVLFSLPAGSSDINLVKKGL
ncbi:MAG: MBL fold metallo-hydrolase [Halieaceae bacterium]|nr:MBL fold metallo-hydrolase [Halieaceae bacterium]